jgi:hypothetical protein
MGAATWLSLPPLLLLSVPMIEALELLSDKEYTDPSGLGVLACFEKPACPWRRLFLAALDLQFLTGMVQMYRGSVSIEGHTNIRVFIAT